ncbi:hypothetical protein QFC24_005382 [Naganishia onofrii]|uniref:Uncharacterized protein n=1 Tax=Naganishia onofrii TaxID=1851511 RepID=A0ACC2XA12_9TREE|nr:hypothetical protein QFC24_005382 [Naganishia onofrii]
MPTFQRTDSNGANTSYNDFRADTLSTGNFSQVHTPSHITLPEFQYTADSGYGKSPAQVDVLGQLFNSIGMGTGSPWMPSLNSVTRNSDDRERPSYSAMTPCAVPLGPEKVYEVSLPPARPIVLPTAEIHLPDLPTGSNGVELADEAQKLTDDSNGIGKEKGHLANTRLRPNNLLRQRSVGASMLPKRASVRSQSSFLSPSHAGSMREVRSA